MGIATGTGPNEKVMQNSRLSLTVIGYGLAAVQPIKIEPKNQVDIIKKTVVKVIFTTYIIFICNDFQCWFSFFFRLKPKIQDMDLLVKLLFWEQLLY